MGRELYLSTQGPFGAWSNCAESGAVRPAPVLDQLALLCNQLEAASLCGFAIVSSFSESQDHVAFARMANRQTILWILGHLWAAIPRCWQAFGILTSPFSFNQR